MIADRAAMGRLAAMTASVSLRRDERQQQMGVPGRSEVKRRVAGEDRWRPVVRIIVHEWPAALHRVLHVGQRRGGPVIFIVASEHLKPTR